jgi:hypothetical protein
MKFIRKIFSDKEGSKPFFFRVVDPDSVGSLDPYPDPQYESGSRRAKIVQKNRTELTNFIF